MSEAFKITYPNLFYLAIYKSTIIRHLWLKLEIAVYRTSNVLLGTRTGAT